MPAPLAEAASSTVSAQRSGHWDSTAIAARTSALRLVSWVESTVPVSGRSRWVRAHQAWNSSGSSAGRPGEPPTSLAESSGTYR